jgi:hypothetical protein
MKVISKLLALVCALTLFASCTETKKPVTGDPDKDLATYVQLLNEDAEAAEAYLNDCAVKYKELINNDPALAEKFVDSWFAKFRELMDVDEAKANLFDGQSYKFSYIDLNY